MNIKIVSTLLVISCLLLTSSDCLPIYLHGHTLRKILVPGLIGASAIGFSGYGVALAASAKKFKDLHDGDKKDDDKDNDFFDRILTIRLKGKGHDDDDGKWHF